MIQEDTVTGETGEIAVEPQYVYASFFQRLLAFIIDSGIVTVLSIPFYILLNNGEVTFYQATLLPRIILTVAYNTYMISHGGKTLGKQALGIKVIAENGQSLSVNQALLREFLGKTVMGVFIIGYFWMLFDKKKQCWQDKIAGTYVIAGS